MKGLLLCSLEGKQAWTNPSKLCRSKTPRKKTQIAPQPQAFVALFFRENEVVTGEGETSFVSQVFRFPVSARLLGGPRPNTWNVMMPLGLKHRCGLLFGADGLRENRIKQDKTGSP